MINGKNVIESETPYEGERPLKLWGVQFSRKRDDSIAVRAHFMSSADTGVVFQNLANDGIGRVTFAVFSDIFMAVQMPTDMLDEVAKGVSDE